MSVHKRQRRLLRRVATCLAICFAWWGTVGSTGALASPGPDATKRKNGFTRKLTAAEMQAFSGTQMPPPAPTNLAATGGGYMVNLTWNGSGQYFHVKRSTTSGSGYTEIGTPTATSFSDQTCTPFVRYYYVVTAQGQYGQSGNSNEANAYATIGQRAGFPERWQTGQANGPYAQVNLVDGNQSFAIPIVGYAGRAGLSVDFALVHNSTDVGLFGWPNPIHAGWTHTYNVSLDVDGTTGDVILREGDSRQHFFRKNIDASYSAQPGIYDVLVKNGDNTYTLTRKNQVKLNFSTGLKLATIVDSKGNTITLNYDGGGKLTSVVDATSRTLTLAYDGSNRLSTITDPANRTWTLIYDANGKLWKVQDPLTYTVILAYDTSSRISSLTDKRSNAWSFQYDASHRVTQVTNPLNGTRTYGWGGTCYMGVCNSVTDENNNSQSWLYDSEGNHKGWCAMDYAETRTYDSSHNLLTLSDRNGRSWQSTFDARGNVLASKDPLNNTTTNTYDTRNNLLTTTNPLSKTWTFTYDTANNQLTGTDPLNKLVQCAYNSNGQRTSHTDENSKVTTFTYDTHGNLASTTDPNSNTVSCAYDVLSRRTSHTLPEPAPNGATTSFTYDALSRLTQVTNPDTTTQTHTWDANGNMLTCVDENSKTTTHVFDALNRETSVTDALNRTVSFGYDAGSRRTTVTDARNTTYTTLYNAINRVTESRYPAQGMPGYTNETMTYDGNGNVTARKNRNGTTIYQVYDNANRLTTIDYPAGTDTTFTYDAASRKLTLSDTTGTTSYGYNDRNELTSATNATGRAVTYTYDNVAGRRLTSTLANYGTWTYAYDNGGRVTSLTNPNSEVTSTTYDKNSRVTQAVYGNSTRANYTYNARNWLTNVTNQYPNLATLSSYTYSYDNAGKRTQLTDGNGDYTAYSYDNAYQLTREWKRDGGNNTLYDYSYTYDNSGNRLTKVVAGQGTTSYTYDSLNRMTAAGNVSYTYDSNGNMLTATSGGQTTNLAYSYENWLTQITYPNQTTNTFQYDGNGIRYSKTDSAGTLRYVRDGGGLLAELDGTNALVAAYTGGASVRRNGVSSFFHHDGLGSTRQLTNAAGALTDAYSYDSFGNTTGQTGTTFNPSKYVGSLGYYSDGDSGLMLLQHRYYDPGAGRFITLDPIKDGINWYAYCGNDPVNGVDPSGTHVDPDMSHPEHVRLPIGADHGEGCVPEDHQHAFRPLPLGYGHCDWKVIGHGPCYYGYVIAGDDRYYVGMCQFLPAYNAAWMEHHEGQHPYIHWINWETTGHPDHHAAGPLVHYIFDVHTKHLKIFCTEDFRDSSRTHQCYSGSAPGSTWPSDGPCPLEH